MNTSSSKQRETDAAIRQRIRRDFEQWSGGFPPESDYQIIVFLDYALSVKIDREFALSFLRDWYEEKSR